MNVEREPGIWGKKELDQEKVRDLSARLGMDLLLASIFERRICSEPGEIFFFLENQQRYLHNAFLLDEMAEAVERTLTGLEEGEKILIFGDRDVDGTSATVLLHQGFEELGFETLYRNSSSNDSYGLSRQVLEEAHAEQVTLIITVDCGCANHLEIAYGRELGIDVIVLDHHVPKEERPEAFALVNPHGGEYPFRGICATVVAGKFLWALAYRKFVQMQCNCCLLDVESSESGKGPSFIVHVAQIRDLQVKKSLSVPLESAECAETLLEFIQDEFLCSFHHRECVSVFKQIFGQSADIHIWDLEKELHQYFPHLRGRGREDLQKFSRLARYHQISDFEIQIQLLFGILEKQMERPQELLAKSLDLMAVATVADMMPLRDENRIIVRLGLRRIYQNPRPGLRELLLELNLLGQELNAKQLSWDLIPVLNAAGRMGKTELLVELLLEKDLAKRCELARELIGLNEERREQSRHFIVSAQDPARKSFEESGERLVYVALPNISRGITGLVANRLAQRFGVPAFVLSQVEEDVWSGSVRSSGVPSILDLMESLGPMFINYGGHAAAAGFSLSSENYHKLWGRLLDCLPPRTESPSPLVFCVDAEIPPEMLSIRLLETLWEPLSPYGVGWPELLLLTKNLLLEEVMAIGKPEDGHLRMLFTPNNPEKREDKASQKLLAGVFWRASKRHLKDFAKQDVVDILYHIKPQFFQGQKQFQLEIIDVKRTSSV